MTIARCHAEPPMHYHPVRIHPVSVVIALVSAVASFVLTELIALRVVLVKYEVPGDASSGDTAGWAFVFLQLMIFPVAVLIGVGIGTLSYWISFTKLRNSGDSVSRHI